MNNSRRNELLDKSVGTTSVVMRDKYTSPRTYGVYQLKGNKGHGREFRYGNHPIRKHELVREFGSATVVALFLSRSDAMELAAIENSRRK